MSLLMDALRRAEENKQDAARAITSGGRAASPGLALEPAAGETPPPAPAVLPDLADHFDALDADLAKTLRPANRVEPRPLAATSAPAPQTDPGREAVRNAFAAKTLPANAPRRTGLWIALAASTLVGVGIVAYFWYQFSAMNGSSLTRAQAPSIASRSPPATPPPTTSAPSRNEEVAAPPPAAFAPPPPRPEQRNAAAAEPARPGPVRLKRTPPETDANVVRGYASLQGNALEAARGDYEEALHNDPRNVDALLALAAIAQRQGRQADAERYQQRAYEADPKDAAAQAAVIGNAAVDQVAAESRLKTLLSAQPESAPLNFAIGNLYSRQNRWSEAQQAYFTAVAADGDNPDYLFNLAVSLDHLRQPKLAAQHYRMALEAADKRPGAFDRERVKKRLLDLQP